MDVKQTEAIETDHKIYRKFTLAPSRRLFKYNTFDGKEKYAPGKVDSISYTLYGENDITIVLEIAYNVARVLDDAGETKDCFINLVYLENHWYMTVDKNVSWLNQCKAFFVYTQNNDWLVFKKLIELLPMNIPYWIREGGVRIIEAPFGPDIDYMKYIETQLSFPLPSVVYRDVEKRGAEPVHMPEPEPVPEPKYEEPAVQNSKSKSKSKSMSKSKSSNKVSDTEAVEEVRKLSIAKINQCLSAYEELLNSKDNEGRVYSMFYKIEDVLQDGVLNAFRKKVNEKREEYEGLAKKSDAALRNNTEWADLVASFTKYKERMSRIIAVACHPDKYRLFESAFANKPSLLRKTTTIMSERAKSINGWLNDKDERSIFNRVTLRHYLLSNYRSSVPYADEDYYEDTTPKPKPKSKTTRGKKHSGSSASAASPAPLGECVREEGRPCGLKSARDKSGYSKEELVQIALGCGWGLTENEIRRLTVNQLCARIPTASAN